MNTTITDVKTKSSQSTLESLRFLTPEQVRFIKSKFGTPVYVYNEHILEQQAQKILGFPNAFGLTVRYSIKACPNKNTLKIFDKFGLYFDASSAWEAIRAINAGINPSKILLTSQELPQNMEEIIKKGVEFDACSLKQLELYGLQFPGKEVSIRINPGSGSGLVKRLTSGGVHSSFGIWHEYIDQAKQLVEKYQLKVKRLHQHIGSGHDIDAWSKIALITLELSKIFGSVPIINLGGGFQVKSMNTDPYLDLDKVGNIVSNTFKEFAKDTNSQPTLEIEPGNFLVANAGSLITTVTDVVSTGENGYLFLKLDSGLTEIMRPSFYGALHPLVSISSEGKQKLVSREYIVVGHCCEAGDVLTPEPFNSNNLSPQLILETEPGDLLVIERAGGYCSSMNMKNFNSFPEAPEVFLRKNGSFVLIRKRQTLEQIIENEIWID